MARKDTDDEETEDYWDDEESSETSSTFSSSETSTSELSSEIFGPSQPRVPAPRQPKNMKKGKPKPLKSLMGPVPRKRKITLE